MATPAPAGDFYSSQTQQQPQSQTQQDSQWQQPPTQREPVRYMTSLPQPRSRVYERWMIGVHWSFLLVGVCMLAITSYVIQKGAAFHGFEVANVFFLLTAIASIFADGVRLGFLHSKHKLPMWTTGLDVLTLVWGAIRFIVNVTAPRARDIDLPIAVGDEIYKKWRDEVAIPNLVMLAVFLVLVGVRVSAIILTWTWCVKEKRRANQTYVIAV